MMKQSIISRNPRICFGKYRIREKRVPICAITSRWRAGETAESIMSDLDLTLEEFQAAIRFRKPRSRVIGKILEML